MTTLSLPITEILLPTCAAWEFQSPEDAIVYTHQIVWLYGTDRLLFGTKLPDGKWITVPIENPGRFGLCHSIRSARAAAHNFIFDNEDGPREMD